MSSKREIAVAFSSAGHKVFPTLWVKKTGGKLQCACVTRPPLRAKDFDKDGCKSPGKHPLIKGNWRDWAETATPQDIGKIWDKYPEANIARAVPKGEIVIDIDEGGQKRGMDNFKDFIDGRKVSWAKTAQTGNGGTHMFRALPADVDGKRPRGLVDVDYKTFGGYTLLPGSNHMSGHDYEWDGALANMSPAEVAEALIELPVAERFLFEESRSKLTSGDLQVEQSADLTPDDFHDIVDKLPNDDLHYDDYMNVLFAISSAFKHSERGRQVAHAWAARSHKYDHAYTDAKWDSIHDGDGRKKKTYKFLLQLAKDNGIELPQRPTTDYDKAVVELNKQYCCIAVGGRKRIIDAPKGKNGRPVFVELLDYDTFASRLVGKTPNFEVPHPLASDPDAVKVKSLGEIYLTSPFRAQYHRMVFDPKPERVRPEDFNTFPGFAVEPSLEKNPHDRCSLFLDHVWENVAQGDEKLYDWVMTWMADIFQRPEIKPGTALVLRGGQGVGKSIVCDVLGKLLGPLKKSLSNLTNITGNFNGGLERTLLMVAEEAFWAGNKTDTDALKNLITNPELGITYKNVDMVMMPNYTRLITPTNHAWAAAAGLDERRLAVIDVGDGWKQDREKFGDMLEQLNDGGYEALMAVFMSWRSKNNSDPSKIPMTDALREQKRRTFTVTQDFVEWYLEQQADEAAMSPSCYPDGVDEPGFVAPNDLKTAYELFRKAHDIRTARWINKVTTKEIFALIPAKRKVVRSKGGLVTGHEIPPLADCLAHFESLIG